MGTTNIQFHADPKYYRKHRRLPPKKKREINDKLDYNNRFIEMAKEAGFKFNKRFIWDKQRIGMGYNGRNRYEQIIFLSKGDRHMPYNLSIPDILSHKSVRPEKRIHDAEKPNSFGSDQFVKTAILNTLVENPYLNSTELYGFCNFPPKLGTVTRSYLSRDGYVVTHSIQINKGGRTPVFTELTDKAFRLLKAKSDRYTAPGHRSYIRYTQTTLSMAQISLSSTS